MNNLAIIPARGGSKGIPRKNIKQLCRKPLIAWTIEAALAAQSLARVVVSTEDPEIAQVCRQFGAEFIIRPSEISGDLASSESALLHTLEYLEQEEGYRAELITFLQCTSPLTLPEDIDGTVEILLKENADSALAVVPFHYFLWRQDENGDAVGINHDKTVRLLRQERAPQFLETGAVYVMRAEGFKKAKHRFFGKTATYVMPPKRCLEIDDPVDFKIAEVFLGGLQRDTRVELLPHSVRALVLDFDGVFTDDRVFVFQDGTEAVTCHRGDGLGLSLLKTKQLSVLVLSSERNSVVEARCKKLGLKFEQGLTDKAMALRCYLAEMQIDKDNVVYVGNDVNDIDCMRMVGCAVAVADASPEVRANADIVLENRGGSGAVREVCDLILTNLGWSKKI